MLTKDEFDKLAGKVREDTAKADNPAKKAKAAALATNLQKYARHITRIATLRRVLDPKDKKAKLLQGTPDTVNAEILRREADLPRLEKTLRAALA